MAGHHDIGCQRTVCLVEMLLLARLGIIFDDTIIVTAKPVVAIDVLGGGIDISQFEQREGLRLLNILVQTTTVGTYPHVAALVEHQLL